jgi:phage-related protein
MADKPIAWVGDSRDSIREFPRSARAAAGRALLRVQQSLPPSDWKPMPGIGPGVVEIRIHAQAEFRVIYVAKFIEAIYVLHAFQKQTSRTRHADIELARARLRTVERRRAR